MADNMTIDDLIIGCDEYMKTFDVTNKTDLKIINMLARAKEELTNVDSIVKSRETAPDDPVTPNVQPLEYESEYV